MVHFQDKYRHRLQGVKGIEALGIWGIGFGASEFGFGAQVKRTSCTPCFWTGPVFCSLSKGKTSILNP